MRIACPDSVPLALAYALEHGHAEMTRALLKAGCDIKFYLHDFKCREGNVSDNDNKAGEDSKSPLSASSPESKDDASSPTMSKFYEQRKLPVQNALIAAHTALQARLTDIDVSGVNNILGMVFGRQDVMEFHRRTMENQGLRSGRHEQEYMKSEDAQQQQNNDVLSAAELPKRFVCQCLQTSVLFVLWRYVLLTVTIDSARHVTYV